MKQPLARALRSVGMDSVDVAARLAVDPKTVQRWLAGRVPYPRHRAALVELTGWMARDLWPSIAVSASTEHDDEIRMAYSHRSGVTVDAWRRLFGLADREIGVLAYSALWLAEDAAIQATLRAKAQSGVRVRIALGDPDGQEIGRRGEDERIDAVMSARIRNALILFESLRDEPDVEIRLHDTVLYTSIYRADDELLVNAHVFGCPASRAPVLHLRQACGDGMAATYLDAFEQVWVRATVVTDHRHNRPRPESTALS